VVEVGLGCGKRDGREGVRRIGFSAHCRLVVRKAILVWGFGLFIRRSSGKHHHEDQKLSFKAIPHQEDPAKPRP